jgi:hypothetical protein
MDNKPVMSAESIAIRTQRCQILRALNECFDVKVFIKSIWRAVLINNHHAEETLFKRDLLYLEKKGYLEITEDMFCKGGPFMDRLIQLTAEGKEVAEQTMNDPALEI